MDVKISIITITFNSEVTIEKTVRSIISQSYKNFEHIIMDNKSKDKTINLVRGIYSKVKLLDHLKIISEKDNGIADAMNKGLDISNGKIINFLHSDDHYIDTKLLERVNKEFSQRDDLLIFHGNIFFNDPKYGSITKRQVCKSVLDGFPFYHQTMFIQRMVFDKLGGFKTNYQIALDYEFFCRLEKNIPSLHKKIFYLNGSPIVWVEFGGISSTKPLDGLSEVKRALKENKLWSIKTAWMVWRNITKSIIKDIFLKLKLKPLLEILRKLK